MWSREDFDEDEDIVKAHFMIPRKEWDQLTYNINTSKSKFLRECIRRVNNSETDLDVLYRELVVKRKKLNLLELEIEELKAKIDELEKSKIKRDIEVI